MAWPFTRRASKALTAAAVPYQPNRPTGSGNAPIVVRKPRDWQRGAAGHYDSVWLVKKGLNVHADLVSRVRLYVGYTFGDDEERPAEVVAEATREVVPNPDGTPGRPNALTPAQAQLAVDELDRLQASQGGQAAILHDLDLNIQITGECSLVGFPVADPSGLRDEDWTVLSVDELKQLPADDTGPRYARRGPTGRWEPMPAGTYALRVWRPHPIRSWEPDSPLLGIASNCETLTTSEQMFQGQMRSRTSAGVWLFPQEALRGPADPTRSESDGQTEDPTIATIEEAFLDPITDPGSPGSVAPTIIAIGQDLIGPAKEGWFTFDRPMDKAAIEIRAEAKGAVIEGLPLPPEMLEGLGNSSFRNAGQITQNTFDQHVKPDVEFLCASLTSGLLRTAWRAVGLPAALVNRLVVAHDPSDLIAQPDQIENSKAAYEEYLISEDRRRRDLRYSQADAPTEDEVVARVTRDRLLRSRVDPTVETPAAITEAPADEPPAEPVVAAGNSDRAARLASAGRRLAAIDRDLFTRLRAAADVEVTAVHARAGRRAHGSMPRSVAASFTFGAPETILAALGRDYVENDLGMTDSELLSSAFDGLAPRFHAWTVAAQRSALRIVGGVTGMSRDEQEQRVQDGQGARDAAWAVLSAGLLGLVRGNLYDPHPAAPPVGEHDETVAVPATLVREALALAGGDTQPVRTPAGGLLTADGEPVGGVANGPDVMAIFAEFGVVTNGWVWEHGDPTRPFEPHEALDGAEFEFWDDPILVPPPEADWLGVDHMSPGDHGGCSCGYYRQLTDVGEDSAGEAA